MSDSEAGPSSNSYNRNPSGTNRHIDCRTGCSHSPIGMLLTYFIATPGNEKVAELLRQYHHDRITDKKVIAGLLGKKGYTIR